MIESPVFIIGTERSGSNLLRAILNEHPNIAIPHPPHLFREFYPLLPYYGDLNEDRNFRRLVGDAIRLVEFHFVPWPIRVDAEDVIREVRHRDLYCIYAAIHEQYRKQSGKARWGCKSTFMIHHVGEILRHHHRPKLVHLVRDGRDVAVSARRSVFNHYHPYYVARLWSEQQRVAIELGKTLSPDRLIVVRYEDLLSDPPGSVRRICEFLEEDYTDRLLEFFKSSNCRELSDLSGSWKNLSRPLMTGNQGKFSVKLSATEVLEFERVAQNELAHFGYELCSSPERLRERRSPWGEGLRRVFYRCSDAAQMLQVQAESITHDRNAWLRIRKRAFVEILRLKGILRS